MSHAGELAALGTAVCWSFGSLLFAETARRAGAFALNQFRLTVALILLSVLLGLTHLHEALPPIPAGGATWLAISGLIGLTIGDLAYFGALLRLGPRMAAVLSALAPPFTAVLAWPLLGESLGLKAVAGMGLVLLGVVAVVLDRSGDPIPAGHRLEGVLLGILAAVCQAGGLILSKQGMREGIDPLPAVVIRMAAATVGVWVIALAIGQLRAPLRVWSDRTARWTGLGATLLGPTLGVWLSLVAAQKTQAGIAATLMATVPIFVLPLVILVRHERVSARSVLGAVATVVGVALIFLH